MYMSTWHLYSRARLHIVSCVVFALLALAVTPLFSAAPAFAVEAGTGGIATLQVIAGNDASGNPIVVTNARYGFDEGETWKDLLDKAVAAQDLEGYALNQWGFPDYFIVDGVELRNAEDWSKSWSSFINENSGDEKFDTDNYETLQLEDGKRYQSAYDTWPSSIDWSLVPEPASGHDDSPTEEGGDNAGGNSDGDNGSDNSGSGNSSSEAEDSDNESVPLTTAGSYSDTKLDTLVKNITASFEGTELDWNAMDVVAACKASFASKDAIVANALTAYNQPDATNLQRSIIALTAVGVDATRVPEGSSSVDLVKKMATTDASHSTIYSQAFALLAYAAGPYDVPANAKKTVQGLTEAIMATQLSGGGFSFDGTQTDADTTAMMISALATCSDVSGVSESIKKGVKALRSMMNDDGGFGSTMAAAGSNAPSTAQVIIALCAAGIDPLSFKTSNGSTPLSYLLSCANKTNTGFLYGGKENDFATEQGLRALLAYKGFKKAKGAYNIYTQAKDGLLCTNAAKISDDKNNTTPKVKQSGTKPTPTVKPTSHAAMAKTGDPSSWAMIVLATLALISAMLATSASVHTRKDV